MPPRKLKIAIISLTSCEGCEIAVLDLGEKLLSALKNVELIKFKYMMDSEVEKLANCEIAFIEGSPTTARDVALLKEARKKARKIVALGLCAHLGGVQKIKNYRGKERIIKYVYEQYEKIENNEGSGIDKYVKVDAIIPGCPINQEEFLRCLFDVMSDKDFIIKESPVCYECLNNGYECILQKGEICLGPVIYAGCDAICLKSKQPCWGCRGFLPEADNNSNLQMKFKSTKSKKMENLKKKLREIASDKDVDSIAEIFGLK